MSGLEPRRKAFCTVNHENVDSQPILMTRQISQSSDGKYFNDFWVVWSLGWLRKLIYELWLILCGFLKCCTAKSLNCIPSRERYWITAFCNPSFKAPLQLFSALDVCWIIEFLHVDKLHEWTAVFDIAVLLKLLTNLLMASIFRQGFDPSVEVCCKATEWSQDYWLNLS